MHEVTLKETYEVDYDDYYRVRSSPADIYWNGYNSKPDYNDFRALFLNRISSSPFEKAEDRRIYLIQNEEQTTVGFIQLIRRENCIEIGYSVIEQYQRQGYATKALHKAIGLAKQYYDRIIVRIRDDNIASQMVAKKSGFTRTEEYVEKNYPMCDSVKLRTYEYRSA